MSAIWNLKGVLANHVIVSSHFKGGMQHRMENTDGIALYPPVMQTDIERLCIRQLDRPYLHFTKRRFLNTINDCSIAAAGALAQIPFQVHVSASQFGNGDFTSRIVDTICHIALNGFLFLAERFQRFSVNTSYFAMSIGITVFIGTVCSLALAVLQNTTLAIDVFTNRKVEDDFSIRAVWS